MTNVQSNNKIIDLIDTNQDSLFDITCHETYELYCKKYTDLKIIQERKKKFYKIDAIKQYCVLILNLITLSGFAYFVIIHSTISNINIFLDILVTIFTMMILAGSLVWLNTPRYPKL